MTFLFLINYYWSIVVLQCLLVPDVQQSESAIHTHTHTHTHIHIYIYPLFSGFPSHLGPHKA